MKETFQVLIRWQIFDFTVLFIELESCQRTLNLILYKKTCDSPGDDYMSGFTFFCRKNNFTCEDILLTNHPQKSKGLFILTSHGFSASISHVSRWDTGVYWCAVVSNEGRFSLKRVKINLLTPAPLCEYYTFSASEFQIHESKSQIYHVFLFFYFLLL